MNIYTIWMFITLHYSFSIYSINIKWYFILIGILLSKAFLLIQSSPKIKAFCSIFIQCKEKEANIFCAFFQLYDNFFDILLFFIFFRHIYLYLFLLYCLFIYFSFSDNYPVTSCLLSWSFLVIFVIFLSSI